MRSKFKYWGLAVLFISTHAYASTPTHHCGDVPEGFHEWGAFGEKTVYLSHFPMFGSIHSYQVIVEASLSVGGGDANRTFFAAQKSNPSAPFTLSPAKPNDGSPAYWVLPEYVKEGRSFNAKLHFQDAQGKDVVVLEQVTVTVKTVLVNRLFKADSTKPQHLTYFFFGNREEAYLAHAPTWDPDFDQIIRVSLTSLPSECNHQPLRFEFSERAENEASRIKPGEVLSATTDCVSGVQVKALNELFEYKIGIQR